MATPTLTDLVRRALQESHGLMEKVAPKRETSYEVLTETLARLEFLKLCMIAGASEEGHDPKEIASLAEDVRTVTMVSLASLEKGSIPDEVLTAVYGDSVAAILEAKRRAQGQPSAKEVTEAASSVDNLPTVSKQ